MAEIEKKAKRTAKKKYKMPDKITKGEVLQDTRKNTWIIGDSIGKGGFGEIYSGKKAGDPSDRYVIKIEPLENGPLFCERTVYVTIVKDEFIKDFMALKKLKHLGMPGFYGFGSHVINGSDYRFIVIERLGKDLASLLLANSKFPIATVLKLGVQILYVIEYMHSRGYGHNDIKEANLLLGSAKGTENQVYLVDFGLACKFSSTYKPNPKKAHDGTIEYTSRDNHLGIQTRRGDLEILGYNLIRWHTSQLPWENIKIPTQVQAEKETLMKDPDLLLKKCYKTDSPPGAIRDYLVYVTSLEPLEVPDYDKIRGFFTNSLKELKSDINKLEFKDDVKTKEIKTPIKKKPRKIGKSLDNLCDTKFTGKVANGNVSKNNVIRKSPRALKPEKKASWRDCPTIVNGAGYRGDEPPAKKGKK